MSPWLQQLAADANFQMLVARGVKGGSLTFDEVNAVVPELAEPDRLAELVEWLDGHGISLIDDPEPDVAVAESSVPVFGFEAWPDPLDDDTPPVYQRDAAFEERLRARGVPFADAAVSFAADGRVFDAELIVSGEHALAVWLALHNAVSRTGLWPVLEGDVKQSRYWDEILGPEQLDPRGQLHQRFECWYRDRTLPFLPLTPEEIRADAAQNIAEAAKVPPTPWAFRRYRGQKPAPVPTDGPDDEREPPEPNLAELFSERGPFRAHIGGGGCPGYPPHPLLRLRLYPTTVPWEVFAYNPFGGWNDCPWPDEQLTMLRHWHALYGVEVVSRRDDWYELFVPVVAHAPPGRSAVSGNGPLRRGNVLQPRPLRAPRSDRSGARIALLVLLVGLSAAVNGPSSAHPHRSCGRGRCLCPALECRHQRPASGCGCRFPSRAGPGRWSVRTARTRQVERK